MARCGRCQPCAAASIADSVPDASPAGSRSANHVRDGRTTIGSERSRRRNETSLDPSQRSSVAKAGPDARAFPSARSLPAMTTSPLSDHRQRRTSAGVVCGRRRQRMSFIYVCEHLQLDSEDISRRLPELAGGAGARRRIACRAWAGARRAAAAQCKAIDAAAVVGFDCVMRKVVLILLLVAITIAHEAEAGARRSRPLKTGQTMCWDATGNKVNCTKTGQDGELQRGEPRAYVDNGDGTVRDQRTALVWEQLSLDDTIHDKNNLYGWAQASAKIKTLNEAAFGGFTDWRLPNILELITILNWAGPNGGPLAFSPPFYAAQGYYLSSTTVMSDENRAWCVDFESGGVASCSKGISFFVRAVRGGS